LSVGNFQVSVASEPRLVEYQVSVTADQRRVPYHQQLDNSWSSQV